MKTTDELAAEAYALGAQHARNAASWCIDGNTSQEHIRRIVAMMDAGDPRLWDCLPSAPNLSGEWADEMTPLRLLEEVGAGDEDSEAVCDAYEQGVMDTFDIECERIFRAALAE